MTNAARSAMIYMALHFYPHPRALSGQTALTNQAVHAPGLRNNIVEGTNPPAPILMAWAAGHSSDSMKSMENVW
jgi:hypothetical protein